MTTLEILRKCAIKFEESDFSHIKWLWRDQGLTAFIIEHDHTIKRWLSNAGLELNPDKPGKTVTATIYEARVVSLGVSVEVFFLRYVGFEETKENGYMAVAGDARILRKNLPDKLVKIYDNIKAKPKTKP